jgi:hypothetical protein
MKIVFYGSDGAAGKARATELRAAKVHCRLVQADACYEAEACDEIEFMPDVSAFDRQRLSALFGKGGDGAPAKADPAPAENSLSIGKGPGGRWYVKDGKTVHSGPYASEAEAKSALAKEAVG